MNDPFVRNALKYAGAILVGALAAGLGALVVQLNGTDPIVWRPIIAAALGPVVTGLIARQLTRAGSETVAAQVNDLRADGVHRDQMVVLSTDDAATALAGEIVGMSPEGRRRLLTQLEASLSTEVGRG